jgi:glycerate dehydrogenase
MHSIVFLDRATLAPGVRVRRPAFEHLWTEFERSEPADLPERLAGATIVIDNKVALRRETLQQLSDLKLVAIAATGTDCVDKDWCREHGVVVSNVRGYASHTVPEHVFGLILALRRNLCAYRDEVRRGAWQAARQFCFFSHPIQDLHGSNLGIIGEGALGQGVAQLARAFGMNVMFAAHKGKTGLGPLYTPFDEVLETADVISLHCPLLPETRALLGMAEFRRMRRRPVLVNASRGGLVVEEDLERALDEGLLSGAAFDVALPEPPPADSTIMRLAARPDFILTPHIAWASTQAQQALADQLIDNIECFARGTPVNVVRGAF